MVIYIDLIILLNFILDLMLLITVKITLKRNVSFKRLLLGSLIGSISILFLFIPLTSLTLFILKIIVSVFMTLVSFKYESILYTINNLVYLYMSSTVLGGFLYYLNVSYSYDNKGLLFINNGLSINFLFILISIPFFIYFYIKSNNKLKSNYNLYYDVKISFCNHKFIDLVGYLDTGNKLKDPYTNKNIILVEANTLKGVIHNRSPMYVPIKTINKKSLIKCYKPLSIEVNKKNFNNYLIGIINDNIFVDGVNCLLNNKMKEELNV